MIVDLRDKKAVPEQSCVVSPQSHLIYRSIYLQSDVPLWWRVIPSKGASLMRIALAVCLSVSVGCSNRDLGFGVDRAALKGGNSCQIARVKYERGQLNPANECQVCDPVRDNKAWSDVGGGCGSASAIIGAGGGTLTTKSGMTIEFPPGAIDSDTTITVTPSATAPPGGSGAVTPVFDFGPDGIVFAHPVKVAFPLPSSAGSKLAVFWTKHDGSGTFEPIGGTIVGSTMVAEVMHFSSGFVGADPGTRTISGSWVTTFVSGSRIINVPRDLSNRMPAAFTVDAGVISSYYPGTGAADGTFSIPNVPSGLFYVRVRGWLITSASALDLGDIALGRPDEVTAQSTSTLSFNASPMDPWQFGDDFELDCPQNDTWGQFIRLSPSVTHWPQVGDAALAGLTLPDTTDTLINGAFSQAALVEGSKGDRCLLAHLRLQQTNDSPHREFYTNRIEEFDPPAFNQVDGAQTDVPTGPFVPLTATTTSSVDFKASQFAAELVATGAAPNPTQVLFYIIGSPPAANHTGMNINLMWMDTETLDDVVGTNMQWGLPAQGSWEAWVDAQAYRLVTITAPGAGSGQQFYEVIESAFEPSILSTTSTPTAITPALGQPQALQINGNDLLQPQSAVGEAPVLTWTAPTLGAPDLYTVMIYEVDNNNGATGMGLVAAFRTVATSLAIPPGILATGTSYVFNISARRDNSPGAPADPTTAAFRRPRDYDNVSLFSAIVTP